MKAVQYVEIDMNYCSLLYGVSPCPAVLGTSSKVLVDQKSGQSLMYLPLDKLLQQSGTPAADTSPATGTTTSVRNAPTDPSMTTDPRGREALRSREGR